MNKIKVETWTNLAYPIAGFLIDPILGSIFLMLGIFSTGYHYTHEYRWQKADEIGMFLAFFGLIWCGLDYGLVEGIILGITFIGTSIKHREFQYSFIGVLALIAICVNGAWISIPVYLLAMIFKFLEWKGYDYQIVHGIWHIVTAFAMYLTAI